MVNEHVDIDRISSLNLFLLHHILSFLPAQDVVRTCVLSKTWQNIWIFVHTLVLDEQPFKKTEDFNTFVSSLLLLQERSSNLQKFRLNLTEDSPSHNINVNVWIVSALRRNLKVLDIDICRVMRLTNDIFTCEHLREFKLRNNILNLPAKICLPALRSFHLINIQVRVNQLNEALYVDAMPSLEIFIIEDCSFMHHDQLKIYTHNLKTLILEGNFPRSIEISAPSLTSLKLNNTRENIPETIRFCCDHIHLTDAYIRLPIQCFGPMIHSFSMLKNTHTLTMFLPGENHCEATTEVWPTYKFSHLKIVDIQGFQGSENEVNFLKFILENAVVLEKLIILTSRSGYENHKEMMKIGRNLLTYPRASLSVSILFG